MIIFHLSAQSKMFFSTIVVCNRGGYLLSTENFVAKILEDLKENFYTSIGFHNGKHIIDEGVVKALCACDKGLSWLTTHQATVIVIAKDEQNVNVSDKKLNVSFCSSINAALGKIQGRDKIFLWGEKDLLLQALTHDNLDEILLQEVEDGKTGFIGDSINVYAHIPKKIFIDNPYSQPMTGFRHFIRNLENAEHAYLRLLYYIMQSGMKVEDRTGVGALSSFGQTLHMDISKDFPLLCAKSVYFEGVVGELLCFLNGNTNLKDFHARKVRFWDDNADRKVLDKLGLGDLHPGEMGPIYGFNWRHFGAPYTKRDNFTKKASEAKVTSEAQGFDQITALVKEMKTNPDSRRLVLTAWNPTTVKDCCLPPCHVMATFRILAGKLNCMYVMRSNDMFLGAPFNIASYALLTYMLAALLDLQPGILVAAISDAHIYNNHMEQVRELLSRPRRSLPQLNILPSLKTKVLAGRDIKNIQSLDFGQVDMSDFQLNGYHPHSAIKATMNV